MEIMLSLQFNRLSALALFLWLISVYGDESSLKAVQVFECNVTTSKLNESYSQSNMRSLDGKAYNDVSVIRKEGKLNLTNGTCLLMENLAQNHTFKNACSISWNYIISYEGSNSSSYSKLQYCCYFNDSTWTVDLLFALPNCTSTLNRKPILLSCISRSVNVSSLSKKCSETSACGYKLYWPNSTSPATIACPRITDSKASKPNAFIRFVRKEYIKLSVGIILFVSFIVIGVCCYRRAKRTAQTDIQLVTTPLPPASPDSVVTSLACGEPHEDEEDGEYTYPELSNGLETELEDDKGEYTYAYAHPTGYRNKNREPFYVNIAEAKHGSYDERRPSDAGRAEKEKEPKKVYTSLKRTEDVENADGMYQSLSSSSLTPRDVQTVAADSYVDVM